MLQCRRTRILAAFLSLVLMAAIGAPFAHALELLDEESRNRIEALANERIEAAPLVGLAIGIVHDGRTLMLEGFGLAETESERQATEDTRFQIASLSKQFAAVSVMLLVQDGKLDLADAIGDILHGLPESWQAIKVEQLLGHTSGVADYTKLPDILSIYQLDLGRDEVLGHLYGQPLDFEPGSAWEYSNSGYFLIGMIIEEISGMSYADFLARRIFEPLDMRSSYLEPIRNDDPRRAIGYDTGEAGFTRANYNSPSWSFAAGGIVSSLADLARWNQALDNGSILPDDTLESMWTPQTLNDGELVKYGMGWQLAPGPGGRHLVFHRGNKPGFSATMARLKEDKLSVIVLSNRSQGEASQIIGAVGEVLVPRLDLMAAGTTSE